MLKVDTKETFIKSPLLALEGLISQHRVYYSFLESNYLIVVQHLIVNTTPQPHPHYLSLPQCPSLFVFGNKFCFLWVQKARGAPVLEKTLGYNIQYFPENNTNLTKTVNTTNQQLDLYLGGETYWVSVISYNSLGESSLATLRIPAIDEKRKYSVNFLLRCLVPSRQPRSSPYPLKGCYFSRVKMKMKLELFRSW